MCLFIGVYFVFSDSNKGIFHHVQISSSIYKIYIVFVLISIAGLPPIVGFMAKVCVIKITLIYISILFIVFLLFSSLIILFIYIGFSYLAISFSPHRAVTQKKKYMSYKDIIYILSVLLMLPIVTI